MAARNRRHMNEAAAPERAHWPAEHLRAEEVAGQVDRENRVPFGERQIVEPAGPQYGRGVDENVAWSQRYFDRLGRGGNALGARGVAARDERLSPSFAQP